MSTNNIDSWTRGRDQVLLSKGRIEKQKKETWDDVTSIRLEADDHENERRALEEHKRQERYNIIQNEAIQSSTKNAAIEMRWASLLEEENCEELNESINDQLDKCKTIVDEKESLIEEFKQEIKSKDEEYMKALKQQSKDIDGLISRMRSQFFDLRGSYENELKEIEEAFMEERNDILKANKDEIDDLFEKHKRMENEYMENRERQEDTESDQLERSRTKDADTFQKHKIELEKDFQMLQKVMEDMKVLYQLNAEKLDYNSQILEQRRNENQQTINNLKKKQRRLNETFRITMKKYNESEKKYRDENQELTREYKRITKQFKDLQKKFRHFEKADYTKYSDIFNMNEQEIKDLANKVLQADRTIHIQQLGLAWTPPQDLTTQMTVDHNQSSLIDNSKHNSNITEEEPSQNRLDESRVSSGRVKQVFQLLAQECSFLIEDKILEAIEEKPEAEQLVAKVDSIRKSLGIESMEDVELLVSVFWDHNLNIYERPDPLNADDSRAGEDYDPEAEAAAEELEIDMDEILNILKEFAEAQEARSKEQAGRPGTIKKKNKMNLREETEKEKKEREREEEKQYWEKMSKVLDPKTEAVWMALDTALSKYYKLLQDRQNLVEETGLLHQQNEELKTLLNQYLQAGVNHELKVPPTQIIRLDDDHQI